MIQFYDTLEYIMNLLSFLNPLALIIPYFHYNTNAYISDSLFTRNYFTGSTILTIYFNPSAEKSHSALQQEFSTINSDFIKISKYIPRVGKKSKTE